MIASNKKTLCALGFVIVALVTGLGFTLRGVTAVDGTRTIGRAIPLQGATAARVELQMDTGDLHLGVGSGQLLDGVFTFNVDAWEPEFGYQVISREGVLRVEQDDVDGPFTMVYGDAVNRWDVFITPEVPLHVDVDLGSADGTFALAGLDLLGLEIEGDGADAVVDLSGPINRDLDVRIAPGGDLTLTVPSDVGVRVIVSGDASVRAGELRSTGSAYVNESYGSTPLTLTVTVDTDGKVTLLQASPTGAEPLPVAPPDR